MAAFAVCGILSVCELLHDCILFPYFVISIFYFIFGDGTYLGYICIGNHKEYEKASCINYITAC